MRGGEGGGEGVGGEVEEGFGRVGCLDGVQAEVLLVGGEGGVVVVIREGGEVVGVAGLGGMGQETGRGEVRQGGAVVWLGDDDFQAFLVGLEHSSV